MVNLSGIPWRRWQLIVIAIALLCLSLGINSCSQLSSDANQPSHLSSSETLAFVSKHALLTAVVSTDVKPGKDWEKSDVFKALSQARDQLIASFDFNLDEDVRPWLGQDIAFAITNKDLDQDNSNGRQVGYLLVVDADDGDRLREFLELFWQRQTIAGTKPVFTQTSGVPIITGQLAKTQQQIATAVISGSRLLVANDIKVLQQSLRVAQTPTLQLSQSECCTPVWLSLRIPDLVDWLGLATPTEPRFMSALQWQQLTATATFHQQQLVISSQLQTLNNRAFLDKSAAKSTDQSSKLKATTNISDKYLPASLAWGATGHDLRPLWLAVQSELSHYQQLPAPLQLAQEQLSTQLAQTLLQPLAQLLASHYAIGQLNDGSWLMAVEDPAPRLISQLDAIATDQGLTVSQFTLGNQAVTAWSRLKTRVANSRNRETTVETDLLALHTNVDAHTIFSTSIDGLTAALEAPDNRLSDTQRFQHTMPSMAIPDQGYLYGTWNELERLLASNRWFSLIEPILQPWNQSIDSIAITGNQPTVNQSAGKISILLKD
ncbi:DUF3352 domain-containing protein [Leptolyngbyaceae cyanobacterium CCMR0082]|uniref:DUF3352 domain-containing protein n=1 Tax=Adonisia turfae CCMR0082 TaxID=2304604 RepID=A0A6M0S323_9CYAN|nr:DUF3352 domain-containing protein [Adonisia turfae]NEZ62796.1 DUF3352 domain-containing protein [Adonisia turfae CCMR0082]